ncbi:MAG: tetratricopeptide repeat protein [Kofleriaceae bacterium]
MSQAAADLIVEEAHALFRAEKYADAASRYEKAAQVFPHHALAWKGLGHCLLCLGKAKEAARAFDQAIGLRPESATALWGGAVAHADVGNKVVAQNYLRRTLVLQPTWIEMARDIPHLAQLIQTSTRAGDAMRIAFGTYSTRTYRHAGDEGLAVDVGRVLNLPHFGQWTYFTVGLSNREWPDKQRPRVELVLATTVDGEVCGQILANLAFHLAATGFFPEPGVMVRDVIGSLDAGDLSHRLPHVFIAVPRVWNLRLPIDDVPPAITLAQVIPVSEVEYALWKGDVVGFEQRFETGLVAAADLRRSG